ncbi:MAG: CocE/NonD family hydrolase [Bryobacterales bacterium]
MRSPGGNRRCSRSRPGRGEAGPFQSRRSHDPHAGRRRSAHQDLYPQRSGRTFAVHHAADAVWRTNSENNFVTYLRALAEDGYIFVFQDIRGKFGSRNLRDAAPSAPARRHRCARRRYGHLRHDRLAAPERSNNNGRVGLMGVSYVGWTTIMGALEPHPALKAISPQASPADMWLGDDFHHNGAFRLSYAFEYAYMVDGAKESQHFPFGRYDTYDWYLSLGPLSNVNGSYLHGKIPTWNDYVEHPDYDEFWKRQTLIPHIRSVKVPTLNVAGWWDQEDFYGPIRIYEALEAFDKTT